MRHLEVPLFFEYDEGPGLEEDWVSFPLLLSGKKTNEARDEERWYGLFPLFKAVREGREKELHILGMQVYSEQIDHRGFVDMDSFMGPVWYGHSVDEGSYLTVLPFGGTLKGLLGKDYALTVLPPVFMYFEDENAIGPWRSYNILWPIVNWIEGSGRSGFRIWPFYSHYEREDLEGRLAYDRTWILWPFWTSQRNNLNSPAEQRLWFLFPFAGHSWGPKTERWTFLWPFFRYVSNTDHGQGLPYWELRAPFPFFIYGEGKDRWRLDLWPLLGVKEREFALTTGGYERYHRHFAAWPIWRYEHHETDQYDDEKWWVAPLVWKYGRVDKRSGEETFTFKLWPLFRYRELPGGRTQVNFISPLWFNDPVEGAFEEIYGALTSVYESEERPGYDRLRLLWGLYCDEDTPDWDTFAVHPLFWDDERTDGTERDVGVLFGLFRYIRRGDDRALRFFWLPEFPSWTADRDEEEGAP